MVVATLGTDHDHGSRSQSQSRSPQRSQSRSRYQIMNLPERPTPEQIRIFNDEELRAAVIHLLKRVAGPFNGSSGDSARRIWVRRLVEHMEQIR
jgi:hypothetical protein